MELVTIIVPIHKYDDEINKYLEKSIYSVLSQNDFEDYKLLFVGPNDVISEVKKSKVAKQSDKISFLVNDGNTNYCAQVNTAVKTIQSKFFSVLEYDDFYGKNWFKNVDIYVKNKPDISIFLPINDFVDPDNKSIGLVNEITWALSFATELGSIEQDVLLEYTDFTTSGGVFRTDDFIENGMLKESLKLSFWYEYLLRATYKGNKIFVIPKIGYTHMVNRPDSLMDEYKDMGGEERMFWVNLAKKEYFFENDRVEKSKYVKQKNIEDIL